MLQPTPTRQTLTLRRESLSVFRTNKPQELCRLFQSWGWHPMRRRGREIARLHSRNGAIVSITIDGFVVGLGDPAVNTLAVLASEVLR